MKQYSVQQAHLIAHFLDTFPLSREIHHAVPLPRNVLKKYLPSLYYQGGLTQLLAEGIFQRDYFSKEEHKCYYYTAGPTLLRWLEEDKREKYIESLLSESIVSISTGQRAPSYKHLFLDIRGKPLPILNRKAMKSIKTNIINYKKLDGEISKLTWEASQGNYRTQQRAQLRLHTITSMLRHVLRQHHWINSYYLYPAIEYVPAYKGSRFGRLFEQGGGMQSMPKELKNIAYDYAGDVYNYDLRSCHIAIIAQLCREEGHPLLLLEEYVSNKDSKKEYAMKAQIDIRIWKSCLISLFYGAVLGKNKKCSLYRNIWEEYEKGGETYTEDDIKVTYERFIKTSTPFVKARKVWLDILQHKIVPRLQYNPYFIMNQVGCTMMIPEKWREVELRELSAFVCQGYESAFIDYIATLSEEYGWTNRSLEHDGLITSGQIPKEAIAKARNLSAFYTAYLEEESFQNIEQY